MGKHSIRRVAKPSIDRSGQMWVFGAGAATFLAGSIGVLAHDQEPIEDITHHLTAETPIETKIANAANQALGALPIIHCVDETALDYAVNSNMSTLGNTTVEAFTGKPVSVRLDQELCDSLAELPDAFSADESTSYHISAAQALALQILGHEMTHYGDEIPNEGIANCRSIQYAKPLATAFGASPTEAFNVRDTVAHLFSLPTEMGSEYATPAECFEGGIEDLDLTGSTGYWPPVGSVVIRPLYTIV